MCHIGREVAMNPDHLSPMSTESIPNRRLWKTILIWLQGNHWSMPDRIVGVKLSAMFIVRREQSAMAPTKHSGHSKEQQ